MIRRAAVLGQPIAHSLSPVLHRAAYRELGLDWSYEAIECGEEQLAGVLGERTGWGGFSLTMPLKRAALALAATASRRARLIGAANTLLPDASGWRADNTDVVGITAALRGVRCTTATVLGAGGTAQAAVAALAELGVDRCAVLVRDPARTADLTATAAVTGLAVAISRLKPDAEELGADVVISTLPAGAADALATAPWRRTQVLLDVVYRPWPTALAVAAADSGVTVISGAHLLLHQAAAQVQLMTGRPAPVQAMLSALRAALPSAGL